MEFEFAQWEYLECVFYLLAVTPGMLHGMVVYIFDSDFGRLGDVEVAPPVRVTASMNTPELLKQAIAQVQRPVVLEQVLQAPDRHVSVALNVDDYGHELRHPYRDQSVFQLS